MKTLFSIRVRYLGGIVCCLAAAFSSATQAQIPQLHQLQYTTSASLSVSVLTSSDTAALLNASHYPNLRLGVSPQPVLTRTGAVQSLTLPLAATVYKGFLRLKNPVGNLYTDLGYAVTDSAMLVATGEAVSKHGEATFLPSSGNNLKRVLLAESQFQPLGQNLPDGIRPVSKPVSIATWPAVTSFSGTNTLRLMYDADGWSAQEKITIRLYTWNTTLRTWEVAVAAPAVDTVAHTVTAAVPKPGVYALFTINDFTTVLAGFVARTQEYRCLALSAVHHYSAIDSLAQVVSTAGNAIYLSPGFHAVRGSRFTTSLQSVTSLPNVRLAAADLAGSTNGDAANADAGPETGGSSGAEKGMATISPNPAGGKFTLAYELPVAQPVRAVLYTLAGKRAMVLLNGAPKAAGRHQDEFDSSSLRPGVYILSLQLEKGALPSPVSTGPTAGGYRSQSLRFVKTR